MRVAGVGGGPPSEQVIMKDGVDDVLTRIVCLS